MKEVFDFTISFPDIEDKIGEVIKRRVEEGENPKDIDSSKVYPAFIYFVVQQIEKKIEEIDYDPEGALFRNSQSYERGIFSTCFTDESIRQRIAEYEKYLKKSEGLNSSI